VCRLVCACVNVCAMIQSWSVCEDGPVNERYCDCVQVGVCICVVYLELGYARRCLVGAWYCIQVHGGSLGMYVCMYTHVCM
jgi:hypothetical protein